MLERLPITPHLITIDKPMMETYSHRHRTASPHIDHNLSEYRQRNILACILRKLELQSREAIPRVHTYNKRILLGIGSVCVSLAPHRGRNDPLRFGNELLQRILIGNDNRCKGVILTRNRRIEPDPIIEPDLSIDLPVPQCLNGIDCP